MKMMMKIPIIPNIVAAPGKQNRGTRDPGRD